jgi:hypothetical protein
LSEDLATEYAACADVTVLASIEIFLQGLKREYLE